VFVLGAAAGSGGAAAAAAKEEEEGGAVAVAVDDAGAGAGMEKEVSTTAVAAEAVAGAQSAVLEEEVEEPSGRRRVAVPLPHNIGGAVDSDGCTEEEDSLSWPQAMLVRGLADLLFFFLGLWLWLG